jgi:hypothetical protein
MIWFDFNLNDLTVFILLLKNEDDFFTNLRNLSFYFDSYKNSKLI